MKRFVAMILAMMFLLALVGCDSKKENEAATSFVSSNKTDYVSSENLKATGFYSGDLYLNILGKTLIYDKREAGIGSLTKNEVLGTFYTETEIEGIYWEVYSTKEYPDFSYVLVISGTNSSWTYQISEQDSK